MTILDRSWLDFITRRIVRCTATVAVLGVAFTGVSVQSAGAVALWDGSSYGSLVTDNLTITVTSCLLTIGGVSQSGGCTGQEMVAVASPSGAEIKIDALGGGTLFSMTSLGGTSTAYDDLQVTLSIAQTASRTTVSSAAITLNGTAPSADLAKVTGGETVTANGTALPTMFPTLAAPNDSISFGPVGTLSVSKDIRVSTQGVNAGDVLTLSSVTQLYSPAPEPAAIGAFLVGLVGLGAVRRRAPARRRAAGGSASV
ncbi:MAG: PEP-CTERM sorting domain-containing protein [Acetobacteraceae bacterium]|nr:PEP-CTERM sorting domain-containing protein [Acetobacteraceae bacterium]